MVLRKIGGTNKKERPPGLTPTAAISGASLGAGCDRLRLSLVATSSLNWSSSAGQDSNLHARTCECCDLPVVHRRLLHLPGQGCNSPLAGLTSGNCPPTIARRNRCTRLTAEFTC